MALVYFDPVKHEYRNSHGIVRPSATQILASQGLVNYSMVKPDVLAHAATRGTNVHLCTAEYDREGWCDEDWMTEEERGYYQAWLRFLRESGAKILTIEERMIASIAGIELGGTPDRVILLNGRLTVCDLKCCRTAMAAWKLQTALYEMMLSGMSRCGTYQRISVQLFPDGRYAVRTYNNAIEDTNGAIAALILATWDDQAEDQDADAAQKTLDQWKENNGLARAA